GMRNQGWKDSFDSASHRDGTLAEPPIALAEVQAYAYGARKAMADLFGLLGQPERERELQAAAGRTRQLFVQRLALDGELGPVRATTPIRWSKRVLASRPGRHPSAAPAFRRSAAIARRLRGVPRRPARRRSLLRAASCRSRRCWRSKPTEWRAAFRPARSYPT